MTDSSIKLQSTVGGFTAEFIRKLPLVEADMRAHGLDPSTFVISKDRSAAPPAFPMTSPFFCEYTVFVGDDSFTVTEPDDMSFLAFFYRRCIIESPPEEGPTPGLFRRFLRWMKQPI